MKHLFVIIYAVVSIVVSGCSDPEASASTTPENTHCSCKDQETSPIWQPSTLCPKEVGWFMKGFGVDSSGHFKALCAQRKHNCLCEVEK